jgi:hypothetical protein
MSAGSGFSAPGSPAWPEHSDDEAQFLMSGTNTPRTGHPPPYGHSHSCFGSRLGAGRPNSRVADDNDDDDDDGTVPHYKERFRRKYIIQFSVRLLDPSAHTFVPGSSAGPASSRNRGMLLPYI